MAAPERHRTMSYLSELSFPYDPQYWGAVFPLGMYAVSTQQMSQVLGLSFLDWLAPLFLGIAAVAWTAAFIGLLRNLSRYLRTEGTPP